MNPVERRESILHKREGSVSAAISSLAPLEGKALRKVTFKEMLMRATASLEEDESLLAREKIPEFPPQIEKTAPRFDTLWFPL